MNVDHKFENISAIWEAQSTGREGYARMSSISIAVEQAFPESKKMPLSDVWL